MLRSFTLGAFLSFFPRCISARRLERELSLAAGGGAGAGGGGGGAGEADAADNDAAADLLKEEEELDCATRRVSIGEEAAGGSLLVDGVADGSALPL